MPVVNDVHSRLNATDVCQIIAPQAVEEVQAAVRRAATRGLPVAIAGGRHAMGGQQFAAGGLLLDMTGMDRVIRFDAERGLIEIGAGAEWPRIIAVTHALQPGPRKRWGIRQKQTGADCLTLGGAIAANIHGRGLLMGPIVEDIENLTLVDARGEVIRCSRTENAGLFSLVVGGYGLFGIVTCATLRLWPRRPLRRIVNIIDIDEAVPAAYRRAEEGCLYGDFQYAIDPSDSSFLRRGVMACYAPAEGEPVSDGAMDLSSDAWTELLHLAHTDKRRAFDLYAQHYLKTHGQVYWSDLMQLSTYIPSYAEFLARRRARDGAEPAPDESLMIGEMFVPPERILDFMAAARAVLKRTGVEDIYGTIRAIRRDETSFLAWARADYACVIFNLRTPHTDAGIARTAAAFRGLIDAAADLSGSYYLTYHRYATCEQVERCHPRLREFFALKQQHDPTSVFQSNWYRHHLALLGAPVCVPGAPAAQHA
jgi:FAD/FMN-containing dehydrogenase